MDTNHSSETNGALLETGGASLHLQEAADQPCATVHGKSYHSHEELVEAFQRTLEHLHAALEVNAHMKDDIETQSNKIEELQTQLQSTERQYQALQSKLRTLEQHSDPDAAAHAAVVDDRVQDLLARGLEVSSTLPDDAANFWSDATVRERREALLEKGAAQGWLRDIAELQMGELIGSGTFGSTYSAMWRGAKVAVKQTRHPQSVAEAINFLREVECFAAVTHPHVLPFLGACLNPPDECYLVTEFMPGGNLREWLHGKRGQRKPHHPLSTRLSKALDVAKGMAALEGLQPPVIHRDLKPSNVFLDGAGRARIADMNLSLRLFDEHLATMTGETGTYLYMSPEMMRHELYSTKTDVWSFGVMLVELCNVQIPYETLYCTPLQIAIGVADRKLTPPVLARNLPPSLHKVIDMCLDQDPMVRPNFITLVPQLHHILEAVTAREAAAAAAHQNSIFGRVQGMIQGVAGQAAGVAHGSHHSNAHRESSTDGQAPLPYPAAAPSQPQPSRRGSSSGMAHEVPRREESRRPAAPAWTAKPVGLISDFWGRAHQRRGFK